MTAAVSPAVLSPADQGVVVESEEEMPTLKIRNVRMACLVAGQCECPEHVQNHHQQGETTT